MTRLLLFLTTGIVMLCGCKQDGGIAVDQVTQLTGEKTAEVIEIYNAATNNGEYQVGTLRYKEHNEYHGDKLYGTIYYNSDGSVRGKAMMLYKDGEEFASSSKFVNAQDSLLSFYKYEHNDAGQKIRTIAFDPVANEILREERFYYNKEGHQKTKEIYDANGNIRQRFNWAYDKYGNQTAMMVDNGDNTPLMTHTYKITKYTDDKRWLEKWTFLNDEPTTFHKIIRRS